MSLITINNIIAVRPAIIVISYGRSPADFRISRLRCAFSRLRFAWVYLGSVCGTRPHFLQKLEEKNGSEIKRPEMLSHVKTEMKCKVGKEAEGGSEKRKEVVNESTLAPMFQKQQTADDLKKPQEAYNVILEKGKQLGLEEAAHAEPVCRRIIRVDPCLFLHMHLGAVSRVFSEKCIFLKGLLKP